MNQLSAEEVKRLRTMFDRGLGVRAAARESGINRETCGKYFKQWRTAPMPAKAINRSGPIEYRAIFCSLDSTDDTRKVSFYSDSSVDVWIRATALGNPEIERLKKVGSGIFL